MLIVRNLSNPSPPLHIPFLNDQSEMLPWCIIFSRFETTDCILYLLLDSAWLLTLLAMCGGRCSSRVRNFIFLAGHNGGTLGAILDTPPHSKQSEVEHNTINN